MKSHFTTLSVLPAAVLSIAVDLPAQTRPAIHNVHIYNRCIPKPTENPSLQHELLRRKALTSSQQVGYEGPDNTCGFVRGNYGALKSCDTDQICQAALDPYGGSGAIGCCGDSERECTFYDQCVASSDYSTGTICDNECRNDCNVVKCTESQKPSCFRYTLLGVDAMLYSYDSVMGNGTLLTSMTNDRDARTWEPVYYTATGSGFDDTTSSSTNSNAAVNSGSDC